MEFSPVIIYDSKCKFCTKFAEWCRVQNNSFQILPVRDKQARALLKDLDVIFINLNTIYFINNKKLFTKSRAVFEIMELLTFPWHLFSFFKILPLKLTDHFYELFAKYRYQIKI